MSVPSRDPAGGAWGTSPQRGGGLGAAPPHRSLPPSEDYGKTFADITGLLNNTFIRTEFGMAIGPENSGKVGGGRTPQQCPPSLVVFLELPVFPPTQVILTGDVSGGSRGGRIFRSSDFAKNFVQTDLPFHPLVQITYHPRNADCLLALSTEVELGAGWDPPGLGVLPVCPQGPAGLWPPVLGSIPVPGDVCDPMTAWGTQLGTGVWRGVVTPQRGGGHDLGQGFQGRVL